MTTDPTFEALLLHLKEARAFDFTGYKRSTLLRRVERRMAQIGSTDYLDYLDHLEVHPDEFTALFNTILINVTGFFRDPDAWDYLAREYLPPLVAARPDAPVRVWSAGCASGEEAYTLAIVLAELLGPEQFRARVKIYATDVDDEGLVQARQGVYTDREIAGVPAELVERYFEKSGHRHAFRRDLRRSVIFGRNDLVQDAPISRVDLLVCRNTLMYFNAETQAKILRRFPFALAEHGLLFLGKAEMLLSHPGLFTPIDLKHRVFRKSTHRPAVLSPYLPEVPRHAAKTADVTGLDRLRAETFLASPVAQLVVTTDGLVAMTNQRAEALFDVSSRDVGRPFRDLEVSYRPVELRRHIEQAQVERRPIRVTSAEFRRPGTERIFLDVDVIPLVDDDTGLLGTALVFYDVSEAKRLQDDLEATNRQLELAYEELQSTNEELETTNEELQSTVEELETTNEELQSTNEELETMNEELQSTNDELQSINDQLRDTTRQLDDANGFLEAVLRSLRSGVAVLSRDLQVLVWNRRAEDLWGLRRDEAVGQHLLNLDIGLPTEKLRPVIKQALAGGDGPVGIDLDAVNRRGRAVRIRVECSALVGSDGEVSGSVLVMEDGPAPEPPPAR